MEHLLLDDIDSTVYLPVPFVANKYDGGDFLSYPQRQGWDARRWFWIEDYAQKDCDSQEWDHSVPEITAFLQTWLFFGLLTQAMGSITVDLDDFRHVIGNDEEQGVFLSTRKLGGYLERRSQALKAVDIELRTQSNSALITSLHTAACVNQYFNSSLLSRARTPDKAVLERVVFATKLLCELLSSIVFVGNPINILQGVSHDAYLERQMLKAGWCISTVHFMQSHLSLQLQVHAFAQGSVRSRLDHSHCSEGIEEGCRLAQVPTDFKTRHVAESCDCELITAPVDDIVSVLRKGQIPVITIQQEDGVGNKLHIIVEGMMIGLTAGESVYPYVAISHVWANGLGNPKANALPACQIKRLGSILQSLRNKKYPIEILSECHETTAHRQNTFAFWLDTLCIPVDQQYQDLRDFSIQKMRDIYSRASGVVVLDPDLLALPAITRPLTVLTKTLCSSWRSRLWTYQEAALNTWVHLPVDGNCFTFRLRQDLFESRPPSSIIEAQLLHFAWEKYNELACDGYAGHLTGCDTSQALNRMLLAASHRNTSRVGDESICFATFLRLDVRSLLPLAPKDRLPAFLQSLTVIPPEILCAHGRRLEHKGFRWAPSTFLVANGLWDSAKSSHPRTDVDAKTGIELPVPMPVMHRDGLGLCIQLRGLRFHCPATTTLKLFTVSTRDRGTFQVEASDRSTGTPWVMLGGPAAREFGVILMDTGYCHWGIIVEIEHVMHDGTIYCHWLNVVTVLDESSGREDWANPVQYLNFEGQLTDFCAWVVD